MVSIRTVARTVGVSAMTVSRVVNTDPYVSEKTKEKVKEAIRVLNYHPNVLARSLSKKGKSKTIALLLKYEHFLFVDYFVKVLRGIEEKIDEYGYNLVLWRYNPSETKSYLDMTRWYHSGLIRGVILIAPAKGEPLLRTLTEERISFIIVGTDLSSSYNIVDVENKKGAYTAVEHLIKLGHKRIGFIGGWKDSPSADEREQGYIQALLDHDLRISKRLMMRGHFEEEGGAKAIEKLLEISPKIRPTAIFAANDLMAIGAIRVVQRKGLKIPQDIAIVGFDDIDIAAKTSPSLTTVHQPMQKLGGFAAESLMTKKENSAPVQKIFPVRLVVRNSCGAKYRNG